MEPDLGCSLFLFILSFILVKVAKTTAVNEYEKNDKKGSAKPKQIEFEVKDIMMFVICDTLNMCSLFCLFSKWIDSFDRDLNISLLYCWMKLPHFLR